MPGGRTDALATAEIPHFEQIKRIIRTALAGQPLAKFLHELALKIEADVEHTGDRYALEQAIWLRKRARDEQPTTSTFTPETEEKLRAARTDPIEAMQRRGTLNDDHIIAVALIRRCFDMLTRGIDVQAKALDAVQVDNSVKPLRDPADRMSDFESLLLKHVFRPWAAASGAPIQLVDKIAKGPVFQPLTPQERREIRMSGGLMDAPLPWTYSEDFYRARWRRPSATIVVSRRLVNMTTFALVRYVAVDGVSLRLMERRHHVGNGKLQAPLINGLSSFADQYTAARSQGLLRIRRDAA